MKKKIAWISVVATLVAGVTAAYALQNIWKCEAVSGGYTCWVSGTRG